MKSDNGGMQNENAKINRWMFCSFYFFITPERNTNSLASSMLKGFRLRAVANNNWPDQCLLSWQLVFILYG